MAETLSKIEEARCRECSVLVPALQLQQHQCEPAFSLSRQIQEAHVQSVEFDGQTFEITVSMAMSHDQTAVFTIERTKAQLIGLYKVMKWNHEQLLTLTPDCHAISLKLDSAVQDRKQRAPRSFLSVTAQTLAEINQQY